MSLVSLQKYRRTRQKEWLASHEKILGHTVRTFLRLHLHSSFSQVANAYQSMQSYYSEASWDYLDLRDLIVEDLMEPFVKFLYSALQKERWFDARLFSQEELLEICLHIYLTEVK